MYEKPKTDLEARFGSMPDEVILSFKNNQYDECLKSCDEILLTNPTNAGALMYKGIIAQERDNHVEAIAYFHAATEVVPDFYPIWGHKGLSELTLGKYESAIESYKRNVELNPSRAEPWTFMALAYFLQDKNEIAELIFNEVEDRVTDKGTLSLARAILQEHEGNKDAALISYLRHQILASAEDKSVSAEGIYRLIADK